MEQTLQELTKLGGELKEGLVGLQKAQEKLKTDTDGLVKAQVDNVANDIGKKLEAIQDQQQKLQAAVERVGTGTEEKATDREARERKEAFNAFIRAGCDKSKLSPEHVKALATDNMANGGYLVTPEMYGIISGRIFETSPVRQVANVVKTNSKSIEMVLDDDEAAGGWAGEDDTVTTTATPQLGKVEIVAKKLFSYPYITNEMLADSSIDIEAWLVNKISERLGRLENTAFISGNGVSQPRGILTYSPWASAGVYERNKIEQIVNGSTSAPTEAGLIELMGSLKEGYQARASLLMKRSTFVATLKLSGTNMFRFLNLQPQSGPNGPVLGPTLTLMDKPVRLADDMPAIGSNSLSVAYGDFGTAYTIADRNGISVMRDPYTAPGTTKFYAEKRTGGGVTNFDAIKLLKFSAS